MKLPVLCTFALLAAAAASHAGSFGGPPPFTDESPLQSGIDGSYQATAHGKDLTGIIRFAYQNSVQSPIGTANTYSFFVDGQVVSGGVTASITGKNLAGVLGGQDFTVPTSNAGTSELPLVFIVRGNRANGDFHGQMNLEDKMSAFSGNGQITPAPAETNTVVLIQTNNFGGALIIDSNGNATNSNDVSVVPFSIPGSSITASLFDYQGVRTSVIAEGSGGNLGNSAASAGATSTTGQ